MTGKAPAQIALIALALSGLSACGSDGNGETTAVQATSGTAASDTTPIRGGGSIAGISAPADGSFAFDQTDVRVSAGRVTVNFDNPAPLPHDVVIEDESGQEVAKTDLISEERTSTTADLPPGTYSFYCDVPGHREGGMEGTLTAN